MNRDFYLIIDTETCNSIDNPLMAMKYVLLNGNQEHKL